MEPRMSPSRSLRWTLRPLRFKDLDRKVRQGTAKNAKDWTVAKFFHARIVTFQASGITGSASGHITFFVSRDTIW
jgi:hypothetical protein